MRRTEVLDFLARHKGELASRFGVVRLVRFGSNARDEARDDSDVDVLVAFYGAARQPHDNAGRCSANLSC